MSTQPWPEGTRPYRTTCLCGCGETPSDGPNSWMPGHVEQALQERLRRVGDIETQIRWLDDQFERMKRDVDLIFNTYGSHWAFWEMVSERLSLHQEVEFSYTQSVMRAEAETEKRRAKEGDF